MTHPAAIIAAVLIAALYVSAVVEAVRAVNETHWSER